MKIHIKKGDKVRVISGSNKGQEGSVLAVMPNKYRAIVEGVNKVKKHTKPTHEEPGGIEEKEAAIHISNLMLVDPKTGDATRVGKKIVDGSSVRYSKKTGETL
jgi:large subunit ribosomal protein L24